MRFGLLGSLLVDDGEGGVRPVAGVRQRRLLAALLVHANQAVPLDELAEIVWDGAPPAAPAALRTQVMRLRRTVGHAADRIITRDPGYMITLDTAELDVTLFEALYGDASVAVRAGQWPGVLDSVTRALRLWRGAPLSDVASPMLHDECVGRLEQLRTQAAEWRADAELHLGLHEQLVPYLREQARRQPLREHTHAQLMLALYRSGQQAEALEAYHTARRTLADELGIEPGPELQRLQMRILAADCELITLDSDASAMAQSVGLQQLPAAARYFTGRRRELDTLLARGDEAGAADETVVISAIDGMAGIGKTALAVHAAHRLAARFPDGQLFIDLHGYSRDRPPRSPGEALGMLLEALSVPRRQMPRDVELRAALYRQRLAGTRTLVLLDNAASEAQVRPLLPGSAGCMTLVTSRRHLKGLDDAHLLALDMMSEADAMTLVRTLVGPGRAAPEDPALAEIAVLCGRLPLALRIAASLLRYRPSWTLEHLAGLLRSQGERIGALSDGERDLGAVLDLSYAALSEAQRCMFRRLGLIVGQDIDAHAAAALIDDTYATATRLLEDLADHNLLVQRTAGRYQQHDLVRLYAQRVANHESTQDQRAAIDRLLDYYQYTAGRADALVTLYPAPPLADPVPRSACALADAVSAWAWLRAERLNLLAASRYTAGCADWRHCMGLSVGLSTLLRVDGPWSTAVDVHTTAAAAARKLGVADSLAHVLLNLADAKAGNRDYPGAAGLVDEALELYRRTGEQRGTATALTLSGEMKRMMGDCPGAANDLLQAVDLYRSLGERRGLATALLLAGEARRMADDGTAARELEEALALFRELGEPRGEATALNWIGIAYGAAGACEAALGSLSQALRLYQNLDDRRGQANTLTTVGTIHLLVGDMSKAHRALSDALRLYRDLGERRGQTNALALLSEVHRSTAHASERRRALAPDGLHATGATHRPPGQTSQRDHAVGTSRPGAHMTAGLGQSNREPGPLHRFGAVPDGDREPTRLALIEV